MTDYELSFNGPAVVLDVGGFGTVKAVFTRGHHAHVSANTSNYAKGDGNVTYKGIRYLVGLHVWADTGWDVHDDEKSYQPRQLHGDHLLAPGYTRKLREAISEAVAAFLEENPEVPRLAERHHVEQEIEREQQETDKLRQEYESHKARLLGLKSRLGTLK